MIIFFFLVTMIVAVVTDKVRTTSTSFGCPDSSANSLPSTKLQRLVHPADARRKAQSTCYEPGIQKMRPAALILSATIAFYSHALSSPRSRG
uniref:Putative secreted protein n=1 Tax=Ixodes ricinus TaxID=34613 RepID=A0A6B0UCU1_IXORI